MATKKPEGVARPAGRPPKTEVEPAIAKAICRNLEMGLPLTLAAEAEGVGRATVHEWIAKFSDFHGQITRARARGALLLTRRSLRGGPGSGQATWHLERRYREDYGLPKADAEKTQPIVITIEGGLPKRPQ